MKPHLIRQDSPALYNTYHWQTRSTPLGCGHFGVSLYGGVGAEMLDLCDNSMWTGGSAWINNRLCSGNEVLGTVKLDFCKRPDTAEDYERLLDLEQGVSTVRYRQDGVTYTRRAFVSYPDRVCVLRVEADREGEVRCLVSFSAFARPHLLYGGDGCGRTVTLSAHAHTLSAEGVGEYFALPWGAVLSVVAEGKDASVSAASHHRLEVQNADALVVYLTVGTGYTLCPQVFTEPDRTRKLPPVSDLLARLTDTVRAAEEMGYARLLCRHLEDVCPRLSAMTLDLGGADDGRTAEQLIRSVKDGGEEPYLYELMEAYGRYLLLSSSREGTLPASLQGVWNTYSIAPWTSGYWFNINVQMNYWPTFAAGLAECFSAFEAFHLARLPAMRQMAERYVSHHAPHLHEEGRDGWIVGTGNSPYRVGEIGGHSGPGTGGLTAELFWDLYAFHPDLALLRERVLPALEELSLFYTKCLEERDGLWLAPVSSSPEQKIIGSLGYVQTVGCAFDQQMICATFRHYLEACRILGDDPAVDTALKARVEQMAERLDPVIVGASGQVKEFREEDAYGEIGDPAHRHISQLLGAAPCSVISHKTPVWLDATATSLRLRGNHAGAWGLANRMMVWARVGDGTEWMRSYRKLLCECTMPNLWTTHDGGNEFQIDASFGACAATAECLLHSHEGSVRLLPALPPAWRDGSLTGVRARGGFVLSFEWREHTPTVLTVLSEYGLPFVLREQGDTLTVTDQDGRSVATARTEEGVTFPTEKGRLYTVRGFAKRGAPRPAFPLVAKEDKGELTLLAEEAKGGCYTLLAAEESATDYTVCGISDQPAFTLPRSPYRTTYKLVADTEEGVYCSLPVTVG